MKLTESYFSALEESLKEICYDRASGRKVSFEKLFYPLRVEDGKYAFQSYAEQLGKAKESSQKGEDQDIYSRKKRMITASARRVHEKTQNPENFRHRAISTDTETESEETVNKAVEEVFSSTVPVSGKKRSNYNRKLTDIDAEPEGKTEPEQTAEQGQQSNSYESGELERNVSFYGKNERVTDPSLEDVENLALYSMESAEDDPGALLVAGRRVLAVASAGHGKTTLLRRIALYYCVENHPPYMLENGRIIKTEKSEGHRALGEKYSLKDNYTPCLITLRNLQKMDYTMDDLIANSVMEILAEQDVEPEEEELKKFVKRERNRFLLLVDGLDELTDEHRLYFLERLDEYLKKNKETSLIVTSRVAGLLEPRVKAKLRCMDFAYRSIIPLTDDEAKSYAELWIDITQGEDIKARNSLKLRLNQVLTEKKFDYLKEFMRTPLELMIVLKQLSSGRFSMNRFQLFRDMLYGLFTSHERVDKKEVVFEDTMAILGRIAYQMQIRNTLTVTINDISEMLPQLNSLSYHSNQIQRGELVEYLRFLDRVATNVGIVERGRRDGKVIYTFPIRSYQEFLTAHACCHLIVLEDAFRPEPLNVLTPWLSSDEWTRILYFALSDLSSSNRNEYDSLLGRIFEKEQNVARLREIIEADLSVTRDQAFTLCKNRFATEELTPGQRELIMTWVSTESADAYDAALKALYKQTPNDRSYLEASAFATVMLAMEYDRENVTEQVEELISENGRRNAILGAAILSAGIRLYLQEGVEGYQDKAAAYLDVDEKIIHCLHDNAVRYGDVVSVITLTDLWVAGCGHGEMVEKLLTEELRDIVLAEIRSKSEEAKNCVLKKMQKGSEEYHQFIRYFIALGSFPMIPAKEGHQPDLYIRSILEALYQEAGTRFEIDRVALLFAGLQYGWSKDKFLDCWLNDICKGMEPEDGYPFVRMDMASMRESRHFDLFRFNQELLRMAQMSRKSQLMVNGLGTAGFARIMELFQAGKFLEAANYCIEHLGNLSGATRENLAFLIRYGELKPDQLLDPSLGDVSKLLVQGVAQGNAYAVLNMALYYLQNGETRKCRNLLEKMSDEDWEQVHGFWMEELWDRLEDPEGALVCVLASQYGNCEMDEYRDMLLTVRRYYGSLSILKDKGKKE